MTGMQKAQSIFLFPDNKDRRLARDNISRQGVFVVLLIKISP
jgi:hypothetical protein